MYTVMTEDQTRNPRWNEQERSSQGTFMSTGDAMDRKPICANFPVEVSALLRDKAVIENRAQFIRDAVKEKMVREGMLED